MKRLTLHRVPTVLQTITITNSIRLAAPPTQASTSSSRRPILGQPRSGPICSSSLYRKGHARLAPLAMCLQYSHAS